MEQAGQNKRSAAAISGGLYSEQLLKENLTQVKLLQKKPQDKKVVQTDPSFLAFQEK